MFRGFIALVASCVLLAVVGVALADQVQGTISKIDGNKVTVTDKDKKDTVVDVKDAKIKLGKKDGAVSDLKEKQMVTVTYDKKGDVNVASEVKTGKGK